MNKEEFKNKVLEKLLEYAKNKSEKDLTKAIDEYADIIEEGYTHYQGIEYGIDYAAWNISLCI